MTEPQVHCMAAIHAHVVRYACKVAIISQWLQSWQMFSGTSHEPQPQTQIAQAAMHCNKFMLSICPSGSFDAATVSVLIKYRLYSNVRARVRVCYTKLSGLSCSNSCDCNGKFGISYVKQLPLSCLLSFCGLQLTTTASLAEHAQSSAPSAIMRQKQKMPYANELLAGNHAHGQVFLELLL